MKRILYKYKIYKSTVQLSVFILFNLGYVIVQRVSISTIRPAKVVNYNAFNTYSSKLILFFFYYYLEPDLLLVTEVTESRIYEKTLRGPFA